MPDHAPAHESLLKTDFSKGEQFWKFWISQGIRLDGQTVRFKVLSKRTLDGRFEVVCATHMGDDSKVVWAEGYWTTDAELVSFVRGINAALVHMVGQAIALEMIDLSSCRTYDAWNYKMQESTTARLWDSKDGVTVKGEF